MPAPYSAKAIANMFIEKAKETGLRDLSPMKLQKLVYYAHGWHLAFADAPLIDDEVEAWEFGPVVVDLYHAFKKNGMSHIEEPATELTFKEKFDIATPLIDPDDEGARGVIEEVWRVYSQYTSIQLSNMTHAPGTPWALISDRFNGNLPPHQKMPNELIRETFLEKLKAAEGGEA